MNTEEIIPAELESNYYDGCYHCYGKCVIKLRKTKQWRKAIMHGRTGYERYDMEILPCPEYPEGARGSVNCDCRWNDETVSAIRMVPEEMWGLPIRQDVLSETELLVMRLQKRREEGEGVHDEKEWTKASDWMVLQIGNDAKYGRVAYSPSLDIMRKLTFDEFYGGGIVD